MTGTVRLLRVLVRTCWWNLLVWPAVLAVLVQTVASSLVSMYPTAQSRRAYAVAAEAAPGTAAFQGRGYDLTDLGGMLAHELGYLSLIAYPLVGIYLAVSQTRGIEDSGRLDVVTAGPVSRTAPVAAGASMALLVSVVSALGSWGLLVAQGFDSAGSARFVAALSLFLMCFASLALVAGQLVQAAREAYAVALTALLACYLGRGLIDVRDLDATWTSPQSWLAEARPYSSSGPAWPWVLLVATPVVLGAASLLIAERRDLGAGVFPPRMGPRRAAAYLRGPAALFVTLAKGAVLGWVLGAGVFAFAFGYLSRDMLGLVTATGTSSTGPAVDASLDTLLVLYVQLNAIIAIVVGVGLASAVGAEERAGRLGLALSTRQSRSRVWLATTLVTVLAACAVLAWTGLLTGLGLRLAFSDPELLGRGLRSTLQYGPAVGICVSVAVLLTSISPSLVRLVWAVVGWALVVTMRGDMLELSERTRNISPLEWMGKVPAEAWNGRAALVTAAVALCCLGASIASFRRRDLVAG